MSRHPSKICVENALDREPREPDPNQVTVWARVVPRLKKPGRCFPVHLDRVRLHNCMVSEVVSVGTDFFSSYELGLVGSDWCRGEAGPKTRAIMLSPMTMLGGIECLGGITFRGYGLLTWTSIEGSVAL